MYSLQNITQPHVYAHMLTSQICFPTVLSVVYLFILQKLQSYSMLHA